MSSRLHHFWIPVLLLIVMVSCNGKEVVWRGRPEIDKRSQLGLKGPIRQCHESYWSAADSTVTPESLLESTPEREMLWQFSPSGQLTHYKEWKLGTLVHEIELELDTHMQLQASHDFGLGHRPTAHTMRVYAPDGLLREEQAFNGDKRLLRRTTYAYDAAGRLLSRTTTRFGNSTSGERTQNVSASQYAYDSITGLRIGQQEFLDAKLVQTQILEQGRLMQTLNLENGTRSWYEYDAQGRLVRRRDVDASRKDIGAEEWTYDAAGNCIRMVALDAEGNLAHWETSSYDSLGNLVTQCIALPEGGLETASADTTHCKCVEYRHAFDQDDNWIRREYWEDGQFVSMMVRALK